MKTNADARLEDEDRAMTYAIGDKVRWDVRSRTDLFSDVQHVGTVVGVLPAYLPMFEVRMSNAYCRMSVPVGDLHMSRDHESYLVYVPGATPRSKGKLYWPRVSGLRRVGESPLTIIAGASADTREKS